MLHSKRSGMDHTVLPSNKPYLPFLRQCSPDVTTTATEAADNPIAAHYSFIETERMKG